MSSKAWVVGGLFMAGGFAAGWLAGPRQTVTPIPNGAEPRAVAKAAVEKDRFGNRLTGEEGQEPIAEVIDVVDLSQVYEPKSDELAAPIEVPSLSEMDGVRAASAASGCAACLLDGGRAPAEPARRADTSESQKPHADTHGLPHYGEETSEPPSVANGSFTAWLRGACASLWARFMPLTGSTLPAPTPSDEDD